MITFHFQNRKFGPVPGSYNELSGEQLIAIARIFSKELPEQSAKLQALKVLLNKSLFSFAMIPADAKQCMLTAVVPGQEQDKKFIDFIFETNTLTDQVLPVYKGFYGPKKEFDNLTLAEFHLTEVNYHQLVHGDEDEKQEALNNLVAVLYRKPKLFYSKERDKDGDIRMPFNSNEVNYYAKQITSWPKAVKLAILMYYDGCRQYLVTLYDKIFSGGDGSDNEAGMFGMIRGIADGSKYGPFDKVEQLNIHTALNEIEKSFEEAEAIQKRIQNQTQPN